MNRLLNLVWPALYVSETFWRFWYLIIGTILIELLVIKYFLRFSWKKSLLVSVIGNIASGVVGTFLMIFGMLLWHLVADNIGNQGTFTMVNWMATYVLMCLGSVFIETLVIRLIFKERIKRIFLPMLTGNLLTYVFIAFVWAHSWGKEDVEVRKEILKYVPDKSAFVLIDQTVMIVDTAFIETAYNKRNERVDNAKPKYRLQIPFKKQKEDEYTVDFKLLDEESLVEFITASGNYLFLR